MVDYRLGDCCGIQEVYTNEEPTYVFEYEKSANEMAMEIDGEPVMIFKTNLIQLWSADKSDFDMIGYGVIKDGDLL